MASMSIDTLTIARELRDAEMPSSQAEAIAYAIGRSVTEGAATKADIREVEVRIDKLELAIEGKLDRLKVEPFRWFFAGILAVIGAVVAAAKLL